VPDRDSRPQPESGDAMLDVKLESLDLAALLTSRVCHDVINPVGAIVNGIEVLEDDKDGEMRDFALGLIKKSAKQASARLQFCRLAFGAAGSAGASIDTGDAETVSKNFANDDRTTLTWTGARVYMPKNKVKLLLNLIVIAITAIPRGGAIAVTITGMAEDPHFLITAKGNHARIPPQLDTLLSGKSESGTIESQTIQVFYTGLVAQAAAMKISSTIDADTVSFVAEGI
jgi:histidine phosphotransferase ChpT